MSGCYWIKNEYLAELQRSKYAHCLQPHYQKSEIVPQALLLGTFLATQEYRLYIEVLEVNHCLFVASELCFRLLICGRLAAAVSKIF